MAEGGATISAIELQITSDADKAAKALNKLANSLNRIKGIINSGMNFDSLAKQIESFGNTVNSAFNNETVRNVERYANAMNRLKRKAVSKDQFGGMSEGVSQMENMISLVRTYSEMVSKASGQYAPWALPGSVNPHNSFAGAIDVTDSVRDMEHATSQIEQVADTVEKSKGKFNLSFLKVSMEDVNSFLNVFSKGASAIARPIAAITKGVASLMASGVRNIGSALASGFQKATSAVKEFAKRLSLSNTTLGRLLHTIGRVAMMRAIRAGLKLVVEGIKEGIENLYRWSDAMNGHFAKSMDSGASAALKFKNSIGAMLGPVIEAVMPLLIQLAEYAIQAANAINQFFNALFGNKTWTRAVDVQTKAYKELKNTGKAAKEAEEHVKNLLADWDELNIIQQKTQTNPTSGSGNKNKYPDYTKMFEEVALGKNRWTELGKEIRAEIAAGDWAGVGKTIANQINYAISLIQPKKIADKLNEVIGNALDMANAFLAETHFEELGKKIGSFLDGIFTGDGYLNWGKWGLFMRLRLFAMIRTLKGVVETPSLFSDIGKALANTVNTFFDFSDEEKDTLAKTLAGSINGIGETVSSFISETNFASIGTTVNDILMKILSGDGAIHAGLIGDNIRNAIVSAFEFVKTAFGTGEDENVLTAIGDKAAELVNGLFNFDDTQTATIGQGISEAVKGAFNGLTTFFDGVSTENLTNSIVGIIKNLDWLGMADSAIKGASAGLKFVGRLAQSIREAFSELKKQLPGVIDSVGQWLVSDEGLETIVGVGKDIGAALWEGITLALSATETIMKNLIWLAHEIVATVVNEVVGSEVFQHFADADSYQAFLANGEDLKGFEHDERGRYYLDTSPTAEVERAAELLDEQMAIYGKTRDEVDEVIADLKKKMAETPWEVEKAKYDQQIQYLETAKGLYEEAATNLDAVNKAASDASVDGLAKVEETVSEITEVTKNNGGIKLDIPTDEVSESIQVLITDYGELGSHVAETSANVVIKNEKISESISQPLAFTVVDDSSMINGLKNTTNTVNDYMTEIRKSFESIMGLDGIGIHVSVDGTAYGGGGAHFANGGFPTTGQMFIARESGPEMVGRIGHSNAVANNEQIVDGVASGVAAGQAEQNALLRQQNQYLLQLLNKPFTAEIGPSRRFAEVSRQSERMLARSTGGR